VKNREDLAKACCPRRFASQSEAAGAKRRADAFFVYYFEAGKTEQELTAENAEKKLKLKSAKSVVEKVNRSGAAKWRKKNKPQRQKTKPKKSKPQRQKTKKNNQQH